MWFPAREQKIQPPNVVGLDYQEQLIGSVTFVGDSHLAFAACKNAKLFLLAHLILSEYVGSRYM